MRTSERGDGEVLRRVRVAPAAPLPRLRADLAGSTVLGGPADIPEFDRRFRRAFRTGERKALEGLTAPDFEAVDHRPLGLGVRDRDTWIESLQGVAGDATVITRQFVEQRGEIDLMRVSILVDGNTVVDGYAVGEQHDGRMTRNELFELSQLDEARPRLEVLAAATARRRFDEVVRGRLGFPTFDVVDRTSVRYFVRMGAGQAACDALASMVSLSPSALDADDAAVALERVRLVRGFLDGYEAAVTSRVGELHAAGRAAPATDLHARNGGVSSREARRKERRADALDRAPAVADALTSGVITAEHADALANATSRIDDSVRTEFFDLDADLARDAGRLTPEQFGRNCRDLVALLERDHGVERHERHRRETSLTTDIDREGMYVLRGRLHPELGSLVVNTLDAEVEALATSGAHPDADRAQLRAEALGTLLAGGHQAKRPAEAEIRVHIDAATLSDGSLHPDSVCELDDGSPLPPASVLRLLCTGATMPIIVGADGVVLDVGRQHRLANRQQRRALRAMYRTCALDGCDVTFNRCEIHHVRPWEQGGPTDLANLVPICSRHHHLVHEGGWSLHLEPDRTLIVRRPDGSEFARCPLERAGRTPRSLPPTRRGRADLLIA